MKSPKGSLTGCAIGHVENATVTASTDIITSNGHPFENDEPIVFLYGSTANAGTVFYVRDVTTDTFKLSSTRGGSAFNFTSDGTAHIGSLFVKVPTGNHKMITDCTAATNWTGGTNVTVTAPTAGSLYWSNNILLTVGASPATGRLALYDIGSTTDLSSWSAIEMFLSHNAARASGTWTIRFYSDVGTTEIAGSAITIPAHVQAGTLMVRFEKRSALPSGVRSIALETSGSVPAAATIRILSFGATHSPHVTPNAITTTCIFSKSSYASGDWKRYGNQSAIYRCCGYISDTRILLGSAAPSWAFAWLGPVVTSSDTLYVYHAMYGTYTVTSSNDDISEPAEAGTATARNTLGGGYNSTDMSTRDDSDITVIGFFSSACKVWSSNQNAYYDWSRIFFLGPFGGSSGGTNIDRSFTDCGFLSASSLGFSAERLRFDGFIVGNLASGTYAFGPGSKASGMKFFCTSSTGVSISVNESAMFDDCTFINSAGPALVAGASCTRGGHAIERVSGKFSASLIAAPAMTGFVVGKLEYTFAGSTRATAADAGTVSVERFNDVDGDCRTWGPYHEISRVTDVVDGSANNSMKVGIVSATAAPVAMPLRRLMAIYKHSSAYTAGQTLTVSLRFRRSHATNIIPWLMVRGGAVVATDQKTAMTAAANTWETVTVSFTTLASSEEIYIYWECSANTTATEFFHVNPESLTVTVT
jgi:hypothetical protein